MSSWRVRPERALVFSLREKHPQIYSFLYQTLLLIITFECTIAIARYGPERDGVNPDPVSSTVPTTILPRMPLPRTNSSTPYICVHGAREDYVDLGPQLIVGFHLYPLSYPFHLNLSFHTPMFPKSYTNQRSQKRQ